MGEPPGQFSVEKLDGYPATLARHSEKNLLHRCNPIFSSKVLCKLDPDGNAPHRHRPQAPRRLLQLPGGTCGHLIGHVSCRVIH